METNDSRRLSRVDWLQAALQQCTAGMDTVKVAPLANKLGVTTGSFYWHFKNRQELLDAVLEYWEREMTDAAISAAQTHEGTPSEKLHFIMQEVVTGKLASYDLAIWAWAQSDAKAKAAFRRVLRKRVAIGESLFTEAGFSKAQAEARARILVAYLMGEAILIPESIAKKMDLLNQKFAVLTAPEPGRSK